MSQAKFLSLFAVLILLLSACSTPQLPITEESRELATKLQQHNRNLNLWDLIASTSLTSSEASYSLTAYWQQNGAQYNLRFDAPFNVGILKIKGQAGFSELTIDNKKTIRGIKPEQLIAEVTPFNIPVTGLTHWIRGIAHKNSKHQLNILSTGDTKNITQDGWLIEYDNWEKTNVGGNFYRLPGDINLQQGDLNIRIIPSSWSKPKLNQSNPLFSDLDF